MIGHHFHQIGDRTPLITPGIDHIAGKSVQRHLLHRSRKLLACLFPLLEQLLAGQTFLGQDLFLIENRLVQVRDDILKMKIASEEDLENINNKIKGIVNESVKFAEESPWPSSEEVFKDVYVQEDYPFVTD